MVNKKVLITGGSSGIGRETAKALVNKGAIVVITGRDENKLNTVAKEIGAIPLCFDIAKLELIPEKAREAVELLNGSIDILINNAGIGVFSPLGTITQADFDLVFRTNVFGVALLTQEIASYFKEQNYGDIINVGSTASLKGFSSGSVYAASKFALRGLTQSWQAELRKNNIRVFLINPSEVTTAFADSTRKEREEESNKLGPYDIAQIILSSLEIRVKGFIPELTIWATNPF